MHKAQPIFIEKHLSNFTLLDIFFIFTSLTLLILAVSFAIATGQSIPTFFRLIFFLLIGFSIIKTEYFLPLIISIFILDYFSVVTLKILPSENTLSLIIILISLIYNFKHFLSNFKIVKSYFILSLYFLFYAYFITRIKILKESDFIEIAAIFVLLLGYISREKKSLILLYFSFIFASCLLALQIILYNSRGAEVIRGVWTDPNYLSLLIDMGILLTFNLISFTKSIYLRLFIIFILLLQINGILILASRGGVISVAVSVLYLIRKSIFTKKAIYFGLSIFAIFLIFYYLGLFDLFLRRFQEDNLATAGSRTMIWSSLINEFVHRDLLSLLFGTGSTSSWYISHSIGYITSPHNNYLEILIDYGLIGFSLFWGIIVLIFSKCKNSLSSAVIILIFTGSLSLSPFNYMIPWLFLLFAIFYSNISESELF